MGCSASSSNDESLIIPEENRNYKQNVATEKSSPSAVGRNRLEEHEKIAQKKEKKRAMYDNDKHEEDKIKKIKLVPLKIPKIDAHTDRTKEYTIDDMVQNNAEMGANDWIKYGKKIYSWSKMLEIIEQRIAEYTKTYWDENTVIQGPLVYDARRSGVTRKDLAKLLPVCQVGICVDVPRDQYLFRMKQSVESVLTEKGESEEFKDYINQLSRWLAKYPKNNIYNVNLPGHLDPNGQKFPLPVSDPLLLRKWITAWKPFDLEVPKEGAWIKIELDLFKTDKTTKEQDAIWKKRETRRNLLNDLGWMAKRREKLAKNLKERYERMHKPYNEKMYKNFIEVFEKHSKAFQDLCHR